VSYLLASLSETRIRVFESCGNVSAKKAGLERAKYALTRQAGQGQVNRPVKLRSRPRGPAIGCVSRNDRSPQLTPSFNAERVPWQRDLPNRIEITTRKVLWHNA
jgi:hypothetical protein